MPPITVSEALKHGRRRWGRWNKKQGVTHDMFKIAKNTLHSLPMYVSWVVHILIDCVHGKGNVQTRQSDILESYNDSVVLFIVG